MKPPTNLLHKLASLNGGGVEATVCRRSAALRSLTVNGVAIVEPTLNTEPPPGLAGATLVPWPNRVAGATWNFQGVEQYLEITEPEFGHANHGLLIGTDYEIISEFPDSLELCAMVMDQPGYPFILEFKVRYLIDPFGIRVKYSVLNLSSHSAPFAVGAHPYIRVGDEPVGKLQLEIGAKRALALDATYIPQHDFDVSGTVWDLRDGRLVSECATNATYTGLALEKGFVVHRLTSHIGKSVELWADHDFAWVQVYVKAEFESDNGTVTAIAVEPMTAPPNALRTGKGLQWLESGRRWEAEWGIRLV